MAPSALTAQCEQRVRLPDGRWLGYAEHGDPTGRPVLVFRGAPASRLSYWPDPAIAASLAVRLISPDRPGYGLSTFQPGRAMLDWPGDVTAFAAALGLERFAVLGVSGGAPYALACAYKIPQRLMGVAVVSGMGPLDNPALARTFPLARRLAFPVARGVAERLPRCRTVFLPEEGHCLLYDHWEEILAALLWDRGRPRFYGRG